MGKDKIKQTNSKLREDQLPMPDAPTFVSIPSAHPKKHGPLWYIWQVLAFLFIGFAAFIFDFWKEYMLNNVPPKLAVAIILVGVCLYIGLGVLTLVNWLPQWNLINTITKKVIITAVVIIFVIFTPITYTAINTFLGSQGSLSLPEFGDDSSQIMVHYGRRLNDAFYTQTSVGELKSKPQPVLNINGQNILLVHIADKKIYVDATLFGGYKGKSFFDIPLARTQDFSISTNGYFNTTINAGIAHEAAGGFISDNATVNQIFNNVLNPSVNITDNNYSKLPQGWTRERWNTALVIKNEKNIPVLVLEYKNPYEITVSGLFLTSMGLLKIDNNQDYVFNFGSCLSDLGNYTVDNIFVNSFFDFFTSEKEYNLHYDYSLENTFSPVSQAVEKLFGIPGRDVRNLAVRETLFTAATNSTIHGLLVEFGTHWYETNPIAIDINVPDAQQYFAWWDKPDLKVLTPQAVDFHKTDIVGGLMAKSNVSPPNYSFYSWGTPISSNMSFYMWFVGDTTLNADNATFNGINFRNEKGQLILDKR